MENVIVQSFKNVSNDDFLLAEKYYSILSAINGFSLTERELQLVAFTAIRGNMSYTNIKEDFCKKYSTSEATINNMISKLKKKNVLVKDRGKIKTHPAIVLDFKKNIKLEIKLLHE